MKKHQRRNMTRKDRHKKRQYGRMKEVEIKGGWRELGQQSSRTERKEGKKEGRTSEGRQEV